MSQVIHHILRGALLLTTIITTQLEAAPCCQIDVCDPCISCCPQYPSCNDKIEYTLGAEFLYWRPRVPDLDYAISDENEEEFQIFGNAKRQYMNFDKNPGLRLHFGYRSPYLGNGWNAKAVYTYFHTNGSADRDAEDYLLYAIWLPGDQANKQAQEAEAKGSIDYDMLDAVIHKPISICKNFLASPYFGARVLWYDQKFRTHYTGLDFDDFEGVASFDSEWHGGGLHCGMETRFYLNWWMSATGCVSAYTNCSASILCGHEHACVEFEQIDIGTGESQRLAKENGEQRTSLSNYQLAVGLNWEGCCGCFAFECNIGYEMIHLWNTPHLRRYHDTEDLRNSSARTHSSNVLFQGINIGAKVFF